MELFVNLGVSPMVELLQLPWDGTAAGGGQLLRKCVLGKREWCANVPGGVSSQEKAKPHLAPCSLLNKDDFFLLFINLNLVELDGSVGCCVEMGCLGSAC